MARLLCFLFGHRWEFNRDDWAVVLHNLPTAICTRCKAEIPNVMRANGWTL